MAKGCLGGCGRVAVWSGRAECRGLFGWLVEMGGGGWFNKTGRVTVAVGWGLWSRPLQSV